MTQPTFDSQIARYIEIGFASATGLKVDRFRAHLEALREPFESVAAGSGPAIVVLRREFAGADQLVAAIDRSDGRPQTVIRAPDLAEYAERAGVEIPASDAYIVHGVSKELESRNQPPAEALERFSATDRQPLTIEEGLALWHQLPEVIGPNDGLSLAGSTRGDKRVPAIWISKRRPKLGWCFAGVPHTWLATASCRGRIGVN